ncbi:MAG: DUF5805 domain-containing protein [Halolamina sp.]
MSDDDVDTEQRTVKTRVPAYQKSEWQSHADELGMSQSEFVRTMVQAGHRGFEGVEFPADEEGAETTSDPGGHALEDRVLDVLSEKGPLALEGLTTAVSEELESQLREVVAGLREEGSIEVNLEGDLRVSRDE